jgi:hypothetical protein
MPLVIFDDNDSVGFGAGALTTITMKVNNRMEHDNIIASFELYSFTFYILPF